MRILALDTAGSYGSIALLEDRRLVHEVTLEAPEGFGTILFDEIGHLLSGAGWRVQAVDLFAGATGPGSFTGIRVGLAAVKGLAATLNKPAVGVSNLQALAAKGSAPLRAAVLDARRGEVYGAVYDAALRAVQPETVAPFPAWLAMLPDRSLEFVAADFAPFKATLAGTNWAETPVQDRQRALASSVGLIAYDRLQAGASATAAEIDANYVRRSDAELFWKEA